MQVGEEEGHLPRAESQKEASVDLPASGIHGTRLCDIKSQDAKGENAHVVALEGFAAKRLRLVELLLLEDVAQRGKAVQSAYTRWLSFTRGTGMVSAILREEIEVMSAYGDRGSRVRERCGGKAAG